MYNVHPYFSLENLGRKVHIIHSKIWCTTCQGTQNQHHFLTHLLEGMKQGQSKPVNYTKTAVTSQDPPEKPTALLERRREAIVKLTQIPSLTRPISDISRNISDISGPPLIFRENFRSSLQGLLPLPKKKRKKKE